MICWAKVEPAVNGFPPLRVGTITVLRFCKRCKPDKLSVFLPFLTFGALPMVTIEETIDGFFDFITWWGLTLHFL